MKYSISGMDGESWVTDLLRHAPETRFPSIDPYNMSAEDRDTLAAYLADDDGSLSEEDLAFSRDVAENVEILDPVEE